ncbi:zinc transporter 6-A-like [Convolutriloba macropyga]|uniref:zinc transporter 6-A-like n=1 Tax=Convolutriloba macropyga TaxID=536237 RepID=UPI003F5229C3
MSGLIGNDKPNEPISDKIRSRGVVSANQNAALQNQPVTGQSAAAGEVNLNVDSFGSNESSTFLQLKDALNLIPVLFSDDRARRPLFAVSFNLFLVIFLTYITESTHSLAFRCLLFLAIFDFSSLITSIVSVWVSRQPTSSTFSFGYARCEVLSVFSSSMLAMLGCFIVFKESIEHILVPHSDEVLEPGLILLGTVMTLPYHLFVTYGIKNPAMSYVITAAPSSWLQEHVADVSRALCAIVPGLDKLLLPRINSVVLLGLSCATMLLGSTFLVNVSSYMILDTISAAFISFIMFATMLPLSLYSGKILVQTTPSHVVGQLEKTLREVSTLDGVLEFRKEHFWTIGFNNLCGSVQIRVRRDANEQMVLAHVLSRLSSTASSSNVTVEIFKDDWTQLSAATKFYYNKSCSDNSSKGSHNGHSHSHDHGSHGGHSHDHGSHGGHSHDHGSHGGHGHDHGSHGGHGHDHGSHGGHGHDHGSHGGHSHEHESRGHSHEHGSYDHESHAHSSQSDNKSSKDHYGVTRFNSLSSSSSDAVPRRFTQHQQYLNGQNLPHSDFNSRSYGGAHFDHGSGNPMKMI